MIRFGTLSIHNIDTSCNSCNKSAEWQLEIGIGFGSGNHVTRLCDRCASVLESVLQDAKISGSTQIEIYCVNCGQKFSWDPSMLRLCDDCVAEENTNPAA